MRSIQRDECEERRMRLGEMSDEDQGQGMGRERNDCERLEALRSVANES